MKRSKRIYKRKKRYIKRKAIRNAKPTIRTMTTGFPDRIRAVLRYSDYFNVATDSSGSIVQVFRGNSIFDPDETGTGHQPMFRDNYAAIYGRYLVRASKISVTATNVSGLVTHTMMIVPANTIFSTSDVNIDSTLEQNYAIRTKILPIAQRNSVKLTQYMSTAKIFGARKGQVGSDDLFSAAVATNPQNQWYWNVCFQNQSDLVDQVVQFQVLLHYYVEFYDRLTQTRN